MQKNTPFLISQKPLTPELQCFQTVPITAEEFSIGRARTNSVIMPVLCISRNHCVFKKIYGDWFVEDTSTYGLEINNVKLGKGNTRRLANNDVIVMEPAKELVYVFVNEECEDSEPAKKRMKLEAKRNNDIDNNVRDKFEESQHSEMQHIAEKIYNTQQRQTATVQLKNQLQFDCQKKLQQLENDFALQVFSLAADENNFERQKMALLEEKEEKVAAVKQAMESKISELMIQIEKHNKSEFELQTENNLIKQKLLQERQQFFTELNRENTCKQDLLEKLEAKIKEQEKIRIREKQELEDILKRETDQLKAIKENELKELAEQKIIREGELLSELSHIKQSLEAQVEEMELQRCMAEEQLIIQMNEMKKINEEDKVKMEQLMLDREKMENELNEAHHRANIELEKLRTQVSEREVELATLAAERIQKQAEQSSEVISSLQEQLEKVKGQLQTVESEKNTLLASIPQTTSIVESSSKHSTLMEFGEIMENELQCSICAELFVQAITLGCSHTFCAYCITVWKMKKKECPICRTKITSECKSLVLDSFIDKMVQNLTEEMKQKRADMLKNREEEVASSKITTKASLPQRRNQRNHYRIQRITPIDPSVPVANLTGMRMIRLPEQRSIISVPVSANQSAQSTDNRSETFRLLQTPPESIRVLPNARGPSTRPNQGVIFEVNDIIEIIEDP